MASIGLGLGILFSAHPLLYVVMKYAGALYLLYLAWSIAISPPPQANVVTDKKPMTFLAAVAFQWVNPKALVMAIGSVSSYAGIGVYPYNMFLIAGVFCILGLLSSLSWAGLGLVLQKFLHKPQWVRGFNIVMAILLVLSLYPIFKEALAKFFYKAMRREPPAINPAPTVVFHVSPSFKKSAAKTTTMTTLSLSSGATFEAGPSCKAR